MAIIGTGSHQCQCCHGIFRTSETRYIACGSRPGQLIIQSIVNQGELNQNVMGFNTERVVTGTLQTLRLREIRSASSRPFPSNSVNVKSMMYEYSSKSYREQQAQNTISQDEQKLDESAIPRHLIQNPEEVAKTLPRYKEFNDCCCHSFLYG